MRKQLTRIACAAALLLQATAQAQVLITPTGTDNVLHTSSVVISGLNTASIDVPIGTPTSFTLGQLVACAYLDANGGGVTVKDMASGNQVTVPYPVAPGNIIMSGVPDVTMGNVPSAQATPTLSVVGQAFTMAVGYVGYDPSASGGPNVFVDFYSIEYGAWGGNNPFAVKQVKQKILPMDYAFFAPMGSFRCHGPNPDFAPLGTVHVDVVADPNLNPTLLPYGTPRADHLFVTYDGWLNAVNCSSPTTSQYESWIFCAYAGDDNSNFNSIPGHAPPASGNGLHTGEFSCIQFINNSDWGYQPDIAGIRYDTLQAGMPYTTTPPFYSTTVQAVDAGILAYTHTVANPVAPPYHSIRVEKWFPTMALPFPAVWSNGPSYYTPDYGYETDTNDHTIVRFTHPRIDADDDNLSNNGYLGDAWKVVYESDTFGATLQSTVSNGDGAFPLPLPVYNSNNIDLSPVGAPRPGGLQGNYNHFLPAVAYDGYKRTPAANTQYMMTTATDISGWGQSLTMQPIERTLPTTIAVSPPAPANDYFLVNSAYPTDMASTGYANSVSTPCNAITDTSIIAWASQSSPGTYQIFYKNSKYNTAPGSGYAYRSGGATAVNNTRKDANLVKLFPNPADNTLTLMVPGSLMADNYTITNMVGQEVAHGTLVPGRNTLNVGSLTPGSYVVRLMSRQAECGSHIFEKK